MDMRLFIFSILNFCTTICTSTSTKRICYYKYWNAYAQEYFHSHCYADITCDTGTTINIIKATIDFHSIWLTKSDCDFVCNKKLTYKPIKLYTYEIAELCNGQETCSLRKWKTHIFWELDVTYDCRAETVPKTTPPFSSSTSTITHHSKTSTDSETTSTKLTDSSSTQTPGDDSSKTAESKTGNSSSSDKFPVTIVASSATAVIVVLLVSVVVGIVCIKRRKTNTEYITSTRVQNNGRQNTNLAVTNNVYDETSTPDSGTEPREDSEDYEYAAALVAINTTNENEYNTLNETAKPIKDDPNYDHIPKQSTSVNEISTSTNVETYNTLHENENCKGLNDDPNYDHVSKQLPLEDKTYSHIKGGKSVNDHSNYEVHETDIYSHLKQ